MFNTFFGSDINECDVNTDNCSQFCNNTIGSYQCYCEDGYTLDSDEHTCNGIILVLCIVGRAPDYFNYSTPQLL